MTVSLCICSLRPVLSSLHGVTYWYQDHISTVHFERLLWGLPKTTEGQHGLKWQTPNLTGVCQSSNLSWDSFEDWNVCCRRGRRWGRWRRLQGFKRDLGTGPMESGLIGDEVTKAILCVCFIILKWDSYIMMCYMFPDIWWSDNCEWHIVLI